MIANMAFLVIILSGSVFGAVKYQKRFEEILPLTCISIVLLLFVAGLLGGLEIGVGLVIVLSILVYIHIYIAPNSCKMHNIKNCLLTPAFFVFIGLYVFLHIGDYGLYAHNWDEFSHWMDCVKAMSQLDDFITNPASHSSFPSYPPGMALFQYFFQKLYLGMNPGAVFDEGRMYLAYQVLSLAMLMPFLKYLNRKQPIRNLLTGVAVFTLPLLFYSNFYSSVYIDAFVGILAGSGFAMILISDYEDNLLSIKMAAICMCLVLAKDVGLYFACMIGILYLVNCLIFTSSPGVAISERTMTNAVKAAFPLTGTLLVKLMWKGHLKSSGAFLQFGKKIDLLAYTKMFLLRNDRTYQQESVDNFKNRFFEETFPIGDSSIQISYFALFILLALLLYLVCRILIVRNPSNRGRMIFSAWVVALQLLIYVYSLGATYISNFSENEAITLASYPRYMNIAYLSVWVVLNVSAIKIICAYLEESKRGMAAACLAGCLLVVSPFAMTAEFLSRDEMSRSHIGRSAFDNIVNKINEYCSEDSKVYVVSQNDTGWHYLNIKYYTRPIELSSEPYNSHFGGEDTIWANIVAPGDLQSAWVNDYDFVVLFATDDYFRETYGELFTEPEKIIDQSLFRVNKETGMLESCE